MFCSCDVLEKSLPMLICFAVDVDVFVQKERKRRWTLFVFEFQMARYQSY